MRLSTILNFIPRKKNKSPHNPNLTAMQRTMFSIGVYSNGGLNVITSYSTSRFQILTQNRYFLYHRYTIKMMAVAI